MKKSRKLLWIILSIVLLLAILLAGVWIRFCNHEPQSSPPTQQDETTRKQNILDSDMIVDSLKQELELLIQDIKENNLDSARGRVSSISKITKAARTSIDLAVSVFGTDSDYKIPLGDLQNLLHAADVAVSKIALPAIDLLEVAPLDSLKAGEGFNVRIIDQYLTFAESVMPDTKTAMAHLSAVDLTRFGLPQKITDYLDLANRILDLYQEDPELFTRLHHMLGVEEDRLYLIAVQNSAEIRASGGFPGSFGKLRIQDGILTVGEFSSVVNYMYHGTPPGVQITQEEQVLFPHLSSINDPRDADLCPDFTRVGYIWAKAYEHMHKEPVAGVISITPHIVQRLLDAVGTEITLSDGSVLNGQNAMEVLLHDIYFKYFSTNYVVGRETISDDLFAEAAKKTMSMLTADVSLSRLLRYLPVAQQCLKDRTLMFWMTDPQEEDFIFRMGWDGGLNTDPQQPEAGVYFNCVLPSKMGWYTMINTEIGGRTLNEDGSYSYPMTVTIENTATKEELKTASTYISGGGSGSIYGVAFFFAPAGGTVSDFQTSNHQTIQARTYNGHTLGYMPQFALGAESSVTITYTVTTAPGVDTPLAISQTPTAQNSREYFGVG